jgi:hypothetical protein
MFDGLVLGQYMDLFENHSLLASIQTAISLAAIRELRRLLLMNNTSK